jgi:hypothetical protein
MRVFIDRSGVEWTAWEVRPGATRFGGAERRGGPDRRVMAAPDPVIERRRGPDRRAPARRLAVGLAVALAGGWLAFQAGPIRRRLAPAPEGWQQLADAELAALCDRAAAAPAPPRSG